MVNIVSKFQVPSSNGLGVMMFWRYFHKGWLSDWINESMNDGGVCRTAPATPGLLIIRLPYQRHQIGKPAPAVSFCNQNCTNICQCQEWLWHSPARLQVALLAPPESVEQQTHREEDIQQTRFWLWAVTVSYHCLSQSSNSPIFVSVSLMCD